MMVFQTISTMTMTAMASSTFSNPETDNNSWGQGFGHPLKPKGWVAAPISR
jgi:hypothetical protein